MARRRVGILIFPEVEILDFCGPYEVFSAARLHEGRRREEPSPFEVLLVAGAADPVRARPSRSTVPFPMDLQGPIADSPAFQVAAG